LVREKPALESVTKERITIGSPAGAARLVGPALEREEVEVVVVLCLNTQRNVIAQVEVTRGILNASLIHPREVFRVAIALGANSIIVAHNHPSGIVTPSAEDFTVTKTLLEAGKLLDIPLEDHIIIGTNGKYLSFVENGLM
jgi:DNA repair protein RadC